MASSCEIPGASGSGDSDRGGCEARRTAEQGHRAGRGARGDRNYPPRGATSREPRAARPPPLPAQPPPPLLPTRLPQVSTNGNGVTAPGTSGNKTQRRPRGGPRWGRRPRNEAGPRGPAPLPPPRPHSPARTGPVAPARAPELAEKRSAWPPRSVSPR